MGGRGDEERYGGVGQWWMFLLVISSCNIHHKCIFFLVVMILVCTVLSQQGVGVRRKAGSINTAQVRLGSVHLHLEIYQVERNGSIDGAIISFLRIW